VDVLELTDEEMGGEVWRRMER